jgi:hypothetical protein
MHLSPEVIERVILITKEKLPKQFSTDLAFVSGLIVQTLESKQDAEHARGQLTSELKTYFEKETGNFVESVLQELQDPTPTMSVPEEVKASSDSQAIEKKRKPTQTRPEVSKTTLFLRKVPKDLNSIELLHTYFKQFGEILNVQVFPNKNSASICFSMEESAVAALANKEPVLDNRLIRVSAFRSKKPFQKTANPDLEKQVKTKLAARELKQRRMQLSTEKTKLIQDLLKVLNERREELSVDEQKALLAQIRLLGAGEQDIPAENRGSE